MQSKLPASLAARNSCADEYETTRKPPVLSWKASASRTRSSLSTTATLASPYITGFSTPLTAANLIF